MEELIAQVLTILRGMWRRRFYGLLAAWCAAVVMAAVLWRMPDRFEATARVYVDTKSVLKPLMRDLTVEPDVDQMLQMLARTLITRPNIEILLKKTKLDDPALTPIKRDQLIDRLVKEIKLASVGRDNVFSFTYRDSSPAQARLVVEQLVALFVESDLGAKMRDSDAARNFIDQQIKVYEARLAEAENRLKDFKLRNLGMSDVAGRDYFTRISTLTDELAKLTLDLRAAEQSRDALKRELAGEEVVIMPDAMTTATAPSPELDSRLDAQRRALDELLRRYTDLHPDVIATRRLIARLEEQKQQDLEQKRRASADRQGRTPIAANPVFQQIKLALADADANVAALRVRVTDTQARLTQMRASANRVPQIEAELAQLNRDYSVVRSNYDALVARREKASMSEEVDSTRLAQFRVIEPPRASDKPVFPNRVALAPLVLLAALGAAIGVSFLMTQLLPTVDDARVLKSLTKRPILGSVSMLVNTEATRSARRKHIGFASGVVGLVLFFGVWTALLTLPGRI